MPRGRIAFIFVFIIQIATAAFGGQIVGRVTNAQGTGVAAAKINIAEQNGSNREVRTSPDGSYAVGGLEPGIYTVTVAGGATQGQLRREIVVPADGGPISANFQFPAAGQAVAGAEERNPNLFIYRIDLNDLRNKLTVVRGPDPQYIPELKPEQNYFGAEFGSPLVVFESLHPTAPLRSWHFAASGLLQNSVFNARNFFNVGPLRSSRSSSFDVTASGPIVRDRLSLLLDFSDSFTSGAVNGNIQAPLAGERVPLTTDPQVRPLIAAWLQSFPAELPNLPHVSLRQLNADAPRSIVSPNGLARADYRLNDSTLTAFRYFAQGYDEDPFQLVLGQNPQTSMRFQSAYSNLTHTFSPHTVGSFGFQYDRQRVDLEPTSQYAALFTPLGFAAPPDVSFRAGELGYGPSTSIGPGKQFPRHRVQNRFQVYANGTKTAGRHTLSFGWGTARVQVNDLQADNSRGTLLFTADAAHDAVTNFLLGLPSQLSYAVGNFYRGFRNFEHFAYFGDQMRLTPTFNINFGLRYDLMTVPTEVNHLTQVNFPMDKTEFAPRFGFAWNPGAGKTTIRASYGISYGTMMPVTYGMERYNPPYVQEVQIQAPNLSNLQRLLSLPPQVGRHVVWELSPDLVFPYSHQYGLSIQRDLPGNTQLVLAYIGMRSFHLYTQGVYNRGANVPGIVATTANIDLRRPDPRYFDVNIIESNSNAYYDAAQVAVSKRLSKGLTFKAVYTFGKNLDNGGDFTDTASGVEVPGETGTSPCELCSRVSQLHGPSLFDTPQVFTLTYSYALPFASWTHGWASSLAKGWQITGTTLLQSGIPFHGHTGSDAPGFGNVDGQSQDRLNVVNPAVLGKSIDNPDTSTTILNRAYFNTNIPVAGRGNIGQNTFRKDGTANWNAALGRTFRLPAERSLQFRAEVYNLTNAADFANPGVLFAAETFGKITNTVNKGRQFQFFLKLNF